MQKPNVLTHSNHKINRFKENCFLPAVVTFLPWFVLGLVIYGWSARDFLWHGTVFNYHSWQAAAWLQGHLWLPNVTAEALDLTPYSGHWYSVFPPLPALVMLPFVLVWGLDANQVMVSVALGALNLGLIRLVLARLTVLYPLNRACQVWLTVLFGFGTVFWQSTIQGTVWHLAHICAITLLLLALLAGLDGRRPLLVGLLIGLAGLARPTAWPAILFWFALLLYDHETVNPCLNFRRLWTKRRVVVLLLVGPVLAVVCTVVYNWLRFHSPTDFGYENMLVGSNIRDDLVRYGQFHPHFFWKNFQVAFLNLPRFHRQPPFLVFDLNGNSLLFITPAFLLVPLGLRHLPLRRKKPEGENGWAAAYTVGAGLAVFFSLGLLLLYFNTGQIQFGYRFVEDCLPFLILLVALGWPRSRKWQFLAVGLVGVSVLLNFYGMMWYQEFWPPFFGPIQK